MLITYFFLQTLRDVNDNIIGKDRRVKKKV